MASAFDTTLERLKGEGIGAELHAIALAQLAADFNVYAGLPCFSPMINIIRDPMCGRNSEAYSEDPFLTGEMARAVIHGMRGSDPEYIRAFGGCKHFLPRRRGADPRLGFRPLFATYLPGFARCIEAGGPGSDKMKQLKL